MSRAFHLERSKEGIATLIFDVPEEKMNTFSLETLEELEHYLDSLAIRTDIKVLKLISGKPDSFIAGANLHSFEEAFDQPELAANMIYTGHRVFNKLQALPFPSVAVIHGICVGGGLECALSCTYRFISDHPKTKLGLPEVNLGLFPGWGGTQRLPRLIGLSEGLGIILAGKVVPALKAWKLRLVDGIAASEFFQAKADTFIQSILTPEGAAKVAARRHKRLSSRLLEDNPLGRLIVFTQAKKAVLEKTKGHYPAPLVALELIKKTYPLTLKEGLNQEMETFVENLSTGCRLADTLIPLFFTQEALKKQAPSSPPQEISFVGVIGAGTMGAGLAWLFASHHFLVRLKDVAWKLVGQGLSTARALFDKGVKAKKLTKSERDLAFQRISGTVDNTGLEHAGLILEAATENLDVKRAIFAELESIVRRGAILASNTSSLTIAEMSEGLRHPERFIGMHFFNPVHKMPLVEIVPGKQTSPETVATAIALCKKWDKIPLVVGDCHGFLINRIFLPGANEVVLMLQEGYAPEVLAKALLNFGMPMDPFLLADEIGNDITYKVAKTFEYAYGERMRPAKLLQLMAENELYGKKNNQGFYLYQGKKKSWNPKVKELLATLEQPSHSPREEDALPRFLYGMVNEAARCLEEKVIERPDFLDLGLIMGIGFPPFQGGLLRYADRVGLANVVIHLRRFERDYGMRFHPCALLEQKAREQGKFL